MDMLTILHNKLKLYSYLRLIFIFFIAFYLQDSKIYSEIIPDGTLGSGKSISGPNYKITSDLGKIAGNNLFHSFSEFNIYTNESATFSGPSNISNIISRVTGNQSSYIDGLLKSEIQGADFYFINPNGVMFGKNASIDVSGSFYVSSADYIKLGDNGRFDAKSPAEINLSIANPEAFGFLGNNINNIEIRGSRITVKEGKNIAFLCGDFFSNKSSIKAPEGSLTIFSVGSKGDIKLNNYKLDGDKFDKYGTIN
jgi:filamentous hemagglutinin family protein